MEADIHRTKENIMEYHQRPYAGDSDIFAMANLARKYATDTLHVFDLPYRLSSWALDEVHNIGLWFDREDKLTGWAVLQTPFWTIDIVCPPAAALHQDILAWADRCAKHIADGPLGRPAWYVMVFEDQLSRIHDLEQA